MNKLIFILTGSLLLTGCFGKEIVYKDRIVEVPKIVFKEPPKQERPIKPKWEIEYITADTPNDDVLKYSVITIEQMKDFIEILELALEPYLEPPLDAVEEEKE